MGMYPPRGPASLGGVLLLSAAFLLPVPGDAQLPPEEREWLECTGEARPPETVRPPSYRPLPIADHFFDVAVVAAAVRSLGRRSEDRGCALYLLRWNSGRAPESFGVLEADLPEDVVVRVEEALVEARLARSNRTQFLRVRVVVAPGGEVQIETGIAWEVPASLDDPEGVASVLGGIFLEGAPWRMALLEVFVIADGLPTTFQLARSSGNARVDQHLEWLIPSLSFRAKRVEGIPFEGWLRLPLRLEAREE